MLTAGITLRVLTPVAPLGIEGFRSVDNQESSDEVPQVAGIALTQRQEVSRVGGIHVGAPAARQYFASAHGAGDSVRFADRTLEIERSAHLTRPIRRVYRGVSHRADIGIAQPSARREHRIRISSD